MAPTGRNGLTTPAGAILLTLLGLSVLGGVASAAWSVFRPRCTWDGRWAAARGQIAALDSAIDRYLGDTGQLPERLDHLYVKPAWLPGWRGYLEKAVPPDPWGTPYVYTVLGPGRYSVVSCGPDGEIGTEDDIRP